MPQDNVESLVDACISAKGHDEVRGGDDGSCLETSLCLDIFAYLGACSNCGFLRSPCVVGEFGDNRASG